MAVQKKNPAGSKGTPISTPADPTPKARPKAVTSRSGRALSGEDLFRTPITELELPEYANEDGNPGVVYLRKISTGDALGMADQLQRTGDGEGGGGVQMSKDDQLALVAKHLVDPDTGDRIVQDGDEHKLESLPASAFLRIVNKITEEIRATAGNA